MKHLLRYSGLAACLLFSGCQTLGLSDGAEPEKAMPAAAGKREPLAMNSGAIKLDSGVTGDWIKLPEIQATMSWPQAGGNPTHMVGNPALAVGQKLQRVWRASIGDGSGGRLRILAQPVVAENRVFAMDASGHVAAFDLANGDELWRVSTQAEESEAAPATGGGIAYEQGMIFATTGHAEVLALKAADGSVVWRRKLMNPSRTAPTVAEGRVFVIGADNSTTALAMADGAVQWTHNGMPQAAALMGAAAPAVAADTVISAYSSGELFALRVQNGRVAWGDVLVSPLATGALPQFADIRGAPVIDKGGVFAMGHSGRMAALVLRSGERAWEVDVGGSNTPLVAGNAVFLLTNDQQLLAVRRDNGKIIWQQQLPRLSDPDDITSSPIVWTGPVLAGGRLLAVSSGEKLAEFAVADGKNLASHDLPGAAYIPPAIAAQTILVVTDDGDLVAFR